jgi:hypothetical protein
MELSLKFQINYVWLEYKMAVYSDDWPHNELGKTFTITLSFQVSKHQVSQSR